MDLFTTSVATSPTSFFTLQCKFLKLVRKSSKRITNEVILYGTEIMERRLPFQEEILANIVVSLGDLKVVFTIVAIILWCWVWSKVK